MNRTLWQKLAMGVTLVTGMVSASTLTWKWGEWMQYTWNFTDANWNPGAVAWTDGNEARFTTGQIGVALNTTVRPTSVYSSGSGGSREWLSGTGDIADYNGTPTTVTLNGGIRKMTNTANFTFSGGASITNGATLEMTTATAFGTGPVTLDNGKFYTTAGGAVTMGNDIVIGPGGGSIANVNCQLTWAGDFEVSGPVEMGTTAGSNSRSRINGNITLKNHATFITQTANASWSWSEINGNVTGPTYTVTVNNRGTAVFVSKIQTGTWDVGGFVKTGTGYTQISVANIFGDAKDGFHHVFTVTQGKVKLSAHQFVNELVLGAVSHTETGTYGDTGSGADHELATWSTYFDGGSGLIEVVAASEPMTVILLR